MGSWQLEVFKMFFYVMFPVGAFHIFNQPEVFDYWVTKNKEKTKSLIGDSSENFKKLLEEHSKEKRKQLLEQ